MGIKHTYQSGTANDAGSEVSSTRWNENHTIDSEVTFPVVASPATPSADNLSLFAKSVGGRVVPAFIEPSGMASALQPHIGINKVRLWQSPGNNSAAVSAVGMIMQTPLGTATASNFDASTVWGSISKTEYLITPASATAVAQLRPSAATFTIGGTAAGRGGFNTVIVWGPATGVATTTTRAFAGMRPAAAATDVEPSSLANICGMGWDAADTNVQFMHNDGSGTATKVDLGASFPVPSVDRTTMYRLALFSPNGTTQSVRYRVENLTTGAVATGTVTTNLPATTLAVCPSIQMSVGGTSSLIGIAVSTIYVETAF